MSKSTNKKPSRIPARKAEPLAERLQHCRMMLSLHDMLTDAENARVMRRLAKAGHAPKGMAEGERINLGDWLK